MLKKSVDREEESDKLVSCHRRGRSQKGLVRLPIGICRFGETSTSRASSSYTQHQTTANMLQPRLYRSAVSADASLAALATSLNTLSLCAKHRPAQLHPRTSTIFVRHASHAQQGRANGPGDSAGRRLGAKKTASEYVVPGNIIFKQRGTAESACTPILAQSTNHVSQARNGIPATT